MRQANLTNSRKESSVLAHFVLDFFYKLRKEKIKLLAIGSKWNFAKFEGSKTSECRREEEWKWQTNGEEKSYASVKN